jgi:hypothetical protein
MGPRLCVSWDVCSYFVFVFNSASCSTFVHSESSNASTYSNARRKSFKLNIEAKYIRGPDRYF